MKKFLANWVVLGMGVLVASASGEPAWKSLFDGTDLSAWKAYGKPAGEPLAWAIEGDVLAWRQGGGSLATKETFRDFELALEWKISANGNSGVLFGVDDTAARPWHTGPEIQLLDDARHRDGKNALTSAGAVYSLYPPAKAAAKAVGEWNALRILVQAGRVQCWLNGVAVIDVTIGSADWNARAAKSKFAPFKKFGRIESGRIVLQDHNEPVWFRNIRIRAF